MQFNTVRFAVTTSLTFLLTIVWLSAGWAFAKEAWAAGMLCTFGGGVVLTVRDAYREKW